MKAVLQLHQTALRPLGSSFAEKDLVVLMDNMSSKVPLQQSTLAAKARAALGGELPARKQLQGKSLRLAKTF